MRRLTIDPPNCVVFTHELAVRIGDLNYGNHLGHDTLLSLLHEARARFFAHLGAAEWDTDGCSLVIVDLAVRYRAETRWGQVLRVELGPGEVGSRGCELRYRVSDRDTGAEVALARTGIVFLGRESRRVVPLPPTFRAALEG